MMRRISGLKRSLPAGFVVSVRPRPVSAGHAESLSFAGPNESNQSKGPEHTFGGSACLQTGAVFEAARSSARYLPDPSSLRDFIGRKSLLYRRWHFSDLLRRAI